MTLPTFDGRDPDFTAKLVGARRLKNSVNGNPRYELEFYVWGVGSRVHTTKTDSQSGYDVQPLIWGIRGATEGPTCHVWLGGREGRQVVAIELA